MYSSCANGECDTPCGQGCAPYLCWAQERLADLCCAYRIHFRLFLDQGKTKSETPSPFVLPVSAACDCCCCDAVMERKGPAEPLPCPLAAAPTCVPLVIFTPLNWRCFQEFASRSFRRVSSIKHRRCEHISISVHRRLSLTPHPLSRADNHACRRSPLPQPRRRAHARCVVVPHREDHLPPQLVHLLLQPSSNPPPPSPPPPPLPPPSI